MKQIKYAKINKAAFDKISYILAEQKIARQTYQFKIDFTSYKIWEVLWTSVSRSFLCYDIKGYIFNENYIILYNYDRNKILNTTVILQTK